MAERIELKSLKAALDLLKDKELEAVYSVFKKEFPAIKFVGIYSSMDEVRDELKSRMIDVMNDEYRELKSKVSRLRKKGADVGDIDFNLLEVPLKLKCLNAEFDVKNYDITFAVLKKGMDELKVFDEDGMDSSKEEEDLGREQVFKDMVVERKRVFGLIYEEEMSEGEKIEDKEVGEKKNGGDKAGSDAKNGGNKGVAAKKGSKKIDVSKTKKKKVGLSKEKRKKVWASKAKNKQKIKK